MKKSIDELSLELTNEMVFESFEKGLPPKLAYRWRRWMQKIKSAAPALFHVKGPQPDLAMSEDFEKLVNKKIQEIISIKELKKSDAIASFFDNGIIKMDFGPEVDPEIKKAAIKWAKKKGLNAVEASLAKSAQEFESIIFSSTQSAQTGNLIKKIKISNLF